MSITIMSEVWNLQLPDSEKIVLLALADCANDEGFCWPSMATLAKKCSKTDRTVQTAIKSLCNSGHLSRFEAKGKGCRYIVHPRKNSAPETASPRTNFKKPPKLFPHTPETASDKPSINHHEPSDHTEVTAFESAEDKLTAEEVVEAWNCLAKNYNLPHVSALTPQRRKTLSQNLRQFSRDDFAKALDAIQRSKFLCGENERGWRANFDFLMKPSSFAKLIEGYYDKSAY